MAPKGLKQQPLKESMFFHDARWRGEDVVFRCLARKKNAELARKLLSP